MFSKTDKVLFNKIHAQDRTLYDLLGITPTATTEEIKQNYRRLAIEKHPDKWSGDLADIRNRVEQAKDKSAPDPLNATERVKYEDALNLFKDIAAAYEVLSDPARKAAYDKFRTNAQPAAQVKTPHLLGIVSQIINSNSWAEQKEFLIFFKISEAPAAIERYRAEFKAPNTPREIKWRRIQNIAESELKNQKSTTSIRLLRLHQAIKDSNYDALQVLLDECEKKVEKAPALPPGIKTIAFWKQQFASAGMSSVSLPSYSCKLEQMSDYSISNNPIDFYLGVIYYAARNGKKDIMELAFAAIQTVAPDINLHSVFCEAVSSGDVATIQAALNFFDLKKQAFNPNFEDYNEGMTAWHIVARTGKVEAIRFVAGLPGISLSKKTGGWRFGDDMLLGHNKTYVYKSAIDYAVESGNQEAVSLVRSLMTKSADFQPERKEERPSSSRNYF